MEIFSLWTVELRNNKASLKRFVKFVETHALQAAPYGQDDSTQAYNVLLTNSLAERMEEEVNPFEMNPFEEIGGAT
jgi:hypothetical protein